VSDERRITIRSLDGLNIVGTLTHAACPSPVAAVLVHGGGVTREEGGFFTRMARGLADAGVTSLRFDLRGHGESDGTQQDLTLAAVLNDIRVAIAALHDETRSAATALIGQSFGTGICAYYAAKRPAEVQRLVLLCPQLNYKKRTIDSRPYWTDDRLAAEQAHELTERGYIDFTPTFRHGRAILNEVFWLQPHTVLGEIQAPTMIIHGTGDTLVPIETSRAAMTDLSASAQLVEIDGAQHGFAVDNDPQYLNPQSQAWQADVIETVADWVTR